MMENELYFDVALSYCADNSWLGRDLHDLIADFGFSVYCYDYHADRAGGFLRSRLRDIYTDSRLNVLIWSQAYSEKPNDSIVAMERRYITYRHAEKGEADSLLVLSIDDTPIGRDLETILTHAIVNIRVVGFVRHVIDRLKRTTRQETEFGTIRHPEHTESERGMLHPCSFKIGPSYDLDPLGRWESLGDILVDLPASYNTLRTPYVYLIPSGGVTAFLRHSHWLKTDKSLLMQKRIAASHFVSEVGNRELMGYWFILRTRGIEVVTVYSGEYDRYLNESFRD